MSDRLTLTLLLILVTLAGCSRPDSGRLVSTQPSPPSAPKHAPQDTVSLAGDVRNEVRQVLSDVEAYYTDGIIYYQKNLLDSSQLAFEEALGILAELDFDAEAFPAEAKWMETLLKEIESDYRLTLMSSGVLTSEGSATAFRELFSDISNFKKLKEEKTFHQPAKDSITYDVPIVWNQQVENSLAYLQTVAHNLFESYLSRATRYIPLMEKILIEEGVPRDFVYLPLVESGFNPRAYSYARAMGFWQFIRSTGRRYGLESSWWHDERRDFEKSTRAAARYLKDMYDEFQSWELALAGYNGGEGRVRREISRLGSKNFWKMRFKKQTRDYVPLFMAATIIAKQPEKYGFYPTYEPALEWETIEISKGMSFANIAGMSGISETELELLNPELMRRMTPPDHDNYKLRVPKGKKDAFLAAYDRIPSEKNTSWVRHRIRSGETVSTIAAKYGVSVSAIVAANNMRRPYRIYSGHTLMVPSPGASRLVSYESEIVADGSGTYMVRRGDNLTQIARAHGVSVDALKRANGLRSNTIYPGRKIAIPGSGSPPVATATETDQVHVVRRGETLLKISRKYGVPIAAIKIHNRLNSDRIYPNMKLKIPRSASGAASNKAERSPIFYKVKKGDTLWKIGQLFGVTVQDLAAWNGIADPAALRSGDRLKIYGR